MLCFRKQISLIIREKYRTTEMVLYYRVLEYRVPGTAAPGGECAFTYRSESKKRGEFNSPRYPSNYPSHTNCTYMLDATPNEQVTVVFDHFKVRADAWNATAGLYG